MRPRVRLGWFLALFLLLIPAPTFAGVEWTDVRDTVDTSGTIEVIDAVVTQGVEWTSVTRSYVRAIQPRIDSDDSGPEPVLEQLRGIEWT